MKWDECDYIFSTQTLYQWINVFNNSFVTRIFTTPSIYLSNKNPWIQYIHDFKSVLHHVEIKLSLCLNNESLCQDEIWVDVYIRVCTIWGLIGRAYEECRLLWYKDQVRTWQETHYVSATEPSRLMLCMIGGFPESDYEECRLLGYKDPDRTSQEIHYISAIEPSRLMLCKICSFYDGDYEECRLLECDTVWML
jgi:hypothetical protein